MRHPCLLNGIHQGFSQLQARSLLLMGGIIPGCFLSAFSKEKTTTVPLKKPLPWLLAAIPVLSLFIGIKRHNFEVTLSRVKSF